MRWLSAALLVPLLGQAASLPEKLDALLRAKGAARATWAMEVIALKDGRTLYSRNSNGFLAPASNTKLFSTAQALVRLGPLYRFRTTVRSMLAPDAAGTVSGSIELIGGGDPSLSARAIPYNKDAPDGDPLAAIEALAGALVERGVRRIEGDVVGDDTAYTWEPFADGWTIDDAIWYYGAPVSALAVNDNSLDLTLTPAATAGEPAVLTVSPPISYFAIQNRVLTTASGPRKVEFDRLPGSRELHIWGTLGVGDRVLKQSVAAGDPAQFAADLLYDALTRRGVVITGLPVARHRRAYEPVPTQAFLELAVHESPPLGQLIQVVNKVSQNLHAEMLLREVGRARGGNGSLRDGLDQLSAFAKEVGIEPEEYALVDGSGLSRRDRLTVSALAKLLVYMDRSPYREAWVESLPVGGVDGTLELRFQQNAASRAAGRRISAKTGSLSHVRALSGYAESKTYGRLVFSLMVNNYPDAIEIRQIVDKIGVLLTQ